MALPTSPFVSARSIFAGKSVIQLKVLPALSGVTGATSTLTTLTAHSLTVGDQVIHASGTGFTGLVAATSYFIVAVPTTTTFQLSATQGGSAIAVGTSSAGAMQPVLVFESRKIEGKGEISTVSIKRPDARGKLRKVRTVTSEQAESYVFEMDEGKRLLSIFGGVLFGRVDATTSLWLPDPADSTGNVALKSETDFTCSVQASEAKFGDGDFTKPTITIESTKAGDVGWTADAVA